MPTIVGQCNPRDGASMTRAANAIDYFSTVTLNATQPLGLPLCFDHDTPAGTVLYIEQHDRSGVIIVANVTRDLGGREYLSLGVPWTEITSIHPIGGLAAQRRADNAVLKEVSVVDRPGAAVFPISYSPRDLDAYSGGGGWPNSWPSLHRQAADRAAAYLKAHGQARALEVQYFDPELERLAADSLADVRRRRDSKLLDAHEQERTADYLRSKFERQGFEVPPELATHGGVHRRINVGRLISVR